MRECLKSEKCSVIYIIVSVYGPGAQSLVQWVKYRETGFEAV